MVAMIERTEVSIMRVSVRCGRMMTKKKGFKSPGDICDALLCRVDPDRWEEAMTDAVEHYCERCESTYTLAEYR